MNPPDFPAQSPTQQTLVIGLDLGGTKCAVSVLRGDKVVETLRVPTGTFPETFPLLCAAVTKLLDGRSPHFGVSCGGPLDAGEGVILCPPNLHPSWHGVAIVREITFRFGGTARLMNDANACALAEWQFGAGRGTRNMIFLTSGTGMGSGLVLNGELYEGTTGDAGEIGHVRLRPDGPVGYNKAGSVEGFYSGGSIARMAHALISSGTVGRPPWFRTEVPPTTKQIADAAKAGDKVALDLMASAGSYLGEAIAILVDLFNPERIVIGGFFPHCRELLAPTMEGALRREALEIPRKKCAIVPSELGESIGSHGAIAAAMHGRHIPRSSTAIIP